MVGAPSLSKRVRHRRHLDAAMTIARYLLSVSLVFAADLGGGPVSARTDASVVTLNNGLKMPVASFGLQVVDDDTAQQSVELAVSLGWRNIFTSVLADNQPGVGRAIQNVTSAGQVSRADLFVCGSVNSAGDCSDSDPEACRTTTAAALQGNLHDLKLDYLDMVLLDYPASSCALIRQQWAAFEDAYRATRVRSIAVSNFSPDQLDCILNASDAAVVPALNQMPYSVGHGADTVVADNTARGGIVVQAYSPLGGGELVNDPTCAAIGAAHNRTAAQVALRWIVQRNATFSTNPGTSAQYFKEDLDALDFALTAAEMVKLNAV